jgi:hypothetical protein
MLWSMAPKRSLRILLAAIGLLAISMERAEAQATCVDATGDACLNVIRSARADGVIEDIFTTRDGLYAPQLGFATYVRGVEAAGSTCAGFTHTPTILEGYSCMATTVSVAARANSLDWYWTQILRTTDGGAVVADGAPGFYVPWRGRIYDLGGEANRVALFPITDHPPLPCEAFEYSVWLSNNPDATTIAPEDAPDPNQWNAARLIRTFTRGWTRNPRATGVAEAGRTDLDTWLRDASAGEAVADALVTIWALPCGLSFRYVSIQAGNYGNPGPECVFHSADDELDAVAGLNEDDTAICVDGDGDGHRAASCGGGDCDDTDPAVHPGAFEPCDAARDFDCRPAEACPAGTSCDGSTGLCATACFEGACAGGYECSPDGLCVESACSSRTEPCPSGTICRDGDCVEPCAGVICPRGRVCAGGACIDPCAGVVCPSMQVCVAAEPGARTVCGPACTCSDLAASAICGSARACDARMGSPTMGRCVDPGCETASCGASEICVGGACVSPCAGVVCPLDQICVEGECVVDRCASVVCGTGLECRAGACVAACTGVTCADGERCVDGDCQPDPCFGVDCGSGMRCVEGLCVDSGLDAGRRDAGELRMDAGPRANPNAGGCGCRAGRSGPGLALGTLLGLLALLARRR